MLRNSILPNRSVLVVEDEELVRNLVATTLLDSGYEVVTAANGEEALAAAGSRPGGVDLVLADVVMPGLSGPGVVDHPLKRWPAVKVVFMSGYTGGPASSTAIGSRTLLQKPFGVET